LYVAKKLLADGHGRCVGHNSVIGFTCAFRWRHAVFLSRLLPYSVVAVEIAPAAISTRDRWVVHFTSPLAVATCAASRKLVRTIWTYSRALQSFRANLHHGGENECGVSNHVRDSIRHNSFLLEEFSVRETWGFTTFPKLHKATLAAISWGFNISPLLTSLLCSFPISAMSLHVSSEKLATVPKCLYIELAAILPPVPDSFNLS
jgi:hypothetical protein